MGKCEISIFNTMKGDIVRMEKRITLSRIAAEAGVSLTTASMYINGKAKRYKIADRTCERLEEIIGKYHFRPNFHAMAIARKRTFLIGVLMADINYSFWPDILDGIEDEIKKHQYHMIFATSHYDLQKEIEAIGFMMDKGVDAFIYSSNIKDRRIVIRQCGDKPVVCVTTEVRGIPSFLNNEIAGGRAAASYLFKKGHRKIALVGPRDSRLGRHTGFRNFFREKGISVKCFQDEKEFIAVSGKFTAAFCESDYVLMRLYQQASAAGISIPDDISVIGYDNMEFLQCLNPVPASVNQFKKEIGAAAGKCLMDILGGDHEARNRKTSFIPFVAEGASVKNMKL